MKGKCQKWSFLRIRGLVALRASTIAQWTNLQCRIGLCRIAMSCRWLQIIYISHFLTKQSNSGKRYCPKQFHVQKNPTHLFPTRLPRFGNICPDPDYRSRHNWFCDIKENDEIWKFWGEASCPWKITRTKKNAERWRFRWKASWTWTVQTSVGENVNYILEFRAILASFFV